MMKQLRTSQGDGKHDRRPLRVTTPDLLIIDDLGLRPLVQDERSDLHDIIRIRTRLDHWTSNRALEELP